MLPRIVLTLFPVLSPQERDADFIFYTLMECEKACVASAKDSSAGQASFFGTVITKFTSEGFCTLQNHLGTMPDMKNEVNLLLRASHFVDTGLVKAGSSMDRSIEPGERQSKLMVRLNIQVLLFVYFSLFYCSLHVCISF